MSTIREVIQFCSLLALLVLTSSSCSKNSNMGGGIEQISSEDKEILDAFFQVLIHQAPGGFTLFGQKPVSFIDYILPDSSPVDEKTIFAHVLEEGWKTFQKYPHVFTTGNFILERTYHEDGDLKVVTIAIINKKEALRAIKSNISIFREELGHTFDPDSYIETLAHIDYEKPKLSGILMGYGTKNAWAFQRIREISSYYNDNVSSHDFQELSMESKQSISRHANLRMRFNMPSSSLSPSKGFNSLADELNSITEHYTFYRMKEVDFTLSPFGTPACMCLDDDDEIKQLDIAYNETLSVLSNAYQKRSFLEVTLEQWHQN